MQSHDTQTTPLHLARNNSEKTAKLLIDAGANINAKASDGETLLYCSATGAAWGQPKSHQRYLNLTKYLLSNGPEVNIKLESGDTILHRACHWHTEKEAFEVCGLLIIHGAEINSINLKGHTPLDVALKNNRQKTSKLLRKHGAKTNKELEAK